VALVSIPDRLNAALVLVDSAALAVALAWGARAESIGHLAAAVLVFALLFQTNFALLHEAAHRKLHSRPGWNSLLGLICGTWFGMSYSMFAITHLAHHLKNRTDEEMFDLYYPNDSRLKKGLVWYGMLVGLWYWTIPPANLLLLCFPGAYRRLAERWSITDSLFREPPATLARIRIELLGISAALVAVALALGLSPACLLLFYGAAGFLWSTTQYLEHAYAPRDVVNGAFNLRAPAFYSWLNLHRELDLNHHRWPGEPWLHLPRLSPPGERCRSYILHYLRQWRGPRRALERGPPPLGREDLM